MAACCAINSTETARQRAIWALVLGTLSVCICSASATPSGRTLLQTGCPAGAIDVTAAPYRADPTGSKDSAGPINSAISVSGRTVCFPRGTYAVNSDINFNSNNVNVIAPSGATISYRQPLQVFIRGNSNSINNIVFGCSSAASYSGVVIWGSGNRITNCVASSCGAHGFAFDGQSSSCSSNTISGCTASNNGQIGISQNHCSGNTVSGNTLNGNMLEGITADNKADSAQITGNTVTGNCVAGGVGGIGVDFSSSVSVSSNLVQNTRSGLAGLKTQNNLGPTHGLIVKNNRFISNTGVGVWLFCNGGKCATGAQVSGNTFSGNAATGNACNRQVQVDNPGQNTVRC